MQRAGQAPHRHGLLRRQYPPRGSHGHRRAKRQKALLYALLEPVEALKKAEAEGNFTKRLALHEEARSLPFGLVWEMFCEQQGVPGSAWVHETNYFGR